MYELFYAEPTAAMGTRVVLEEIGAEYRLIDTDISDHAPRCARWTPAAALTARPQGCGR